MHLPLTTPAAGPSTPGPQVAGPAPTADPPAGEADLAELVLARRQDAVGRLTAAAGNSSLCTLSRSGEPRPTVKYLEGAVSALSDVHRELRAASSATGSGAAGSDPTATTALALLGELRGRWLARRGQSAASSPAWLAYLDGAVDALDDLAAAVGTDAETSVAEDDPEPPPVVRAPITQGPPATTPLLRASRWPRRRTIATAVLAPVLFTVLVSAGGGWVPLLAPAWTVLVALTSVVGAATLSTYLPLPGQGLRPNVGCTPCAAMSAMTVLGAAWFLGSAPHQPTMAAVALAAVSFGLVQRLTGAGASCAA
ncbi:hypothetical protein [Georgenia daeguensis]|uniref:Uncharacterized protein n=1 Tax=Georgenia daeguensis TaxID=908355 RepID=A0ABP8EVQ9_9MICO